jgi:hypothetical protein
MEDDMKMIKVVLGGREYEVRQLPIRASREWREKFAAPIEQLLGSVQYAGEALQQALGKGSAIDAGELVKRLGQALLSGVGETVLHSMDLVMEMVLAYSPELRADRERIEAEAYDDEVMAALGEALKLAYPFSEILKFVRIGPGEKPIKKS